MAAHSDFDRATRNALQYAGRDPWSAPRARYFHGALEGIAERFSMTEEQLHARIDGMALGGMLSAFLHEAFMTEPFDDSMSLLAEYIKRRGWLRKPMQHLTKVLDDQLETARHHTTAAAMVANEILRASPRSFIHIWITHAIAASDRPRPELHNTDGHPLLLSHARLPLPGSQDEIIARLSALESWQRDSGESRIWHRYGGPLAAASPRKGGRKKRAASGAARAPVNHGDDEAPRTITATAELESDALIVETNSRERMADVIPELQAALGTLVGEPLIRYQTAEAALKEPRGSQAPAPDVASSPELAQVLQSFKQQHYRRTLDEKIPMLGNRTPRQCARDPKRRAQVVVWLKDLENGEQRQARGSGQPPFDVQWMWQELGLTEER